MALVADLRILLPCIYTFTKKRSQMKAILIAVASGMAVLIGSVALAQNPVGGGSSLDEITVTAGRVNAKPTVSLGGWPRAPVNQITLSYAISVTGHDLSTSVGVADLKKLVQDTAIDVCKEIGRQYPDSTPNDAACAKAAAAKALVKVDELVAARVKAAKAN